jgi:hypothetical protein
MAPNAVHAANATAAETGEVRAAGLLPLWRDGLFWLTLGLTVFALAPFLLPGYFWSANDARHHVYFLFEYDRLVQDGIWWPRWSPDFAFGYGYPFFNIYGPLSHFLAEVLLHFGGFGYTAAVEAVFGLSIVGSAAAMYLFVRDWAGRQAAVVAALVYTYLPYHLLNLYVRANLAESMAFVWLPLCLWAVRGAAVRPGYRWVLAVALSYAGLMLTSNLVIVLFTPVLGAYMLLVSGLYALPEGSAAQGGERVETRSTERLRFVSLWVRRALWPAAGVLLGLGLSAVFWLPAFLEQQYVRVDQWFAGRYDFRDDFVYLSQLFSPRWGFGVSEPGPDDPISFQIGAAALVLAVLGMMLAWRRLGRRRWEALFFAAAGAAGVALALRFAAPLWEAPLVGGILQAAQFPWRWYSIMAPSISILAALVLEDDGDGAGAFFGLDLRVIVVATVVILASYPYLRVQITEPAEGPVSLAGLMRFQRSSDEMTGSTAWVEEIPTWSPMAQHYLDLEAAGQPVTPVTSKLDYGIFDYDTFGGESVAHSTVMEEAYYGNRTGAEQRLVFNHFYYPGWRAYLLDGRGGEIVRELPIIPEETGTLGRMTVPVPPGEGYVLLRYGDTPPRTVGRWMSIATLAGLAFGALLAIIRNRSRNRRQRPDAQA